MRPSAPDLPARRPSRGAFGARGLFARAPQIASPGLDLCYNQRKRLFFETMSL
jgi:hypothetical protein